MQQPSHSQTPPHHNLMSAPPGTGGSYYYAQQQQPLQPAAAAAAAAVPHSSAQQQYAQVPYAAPPYYASAPYGGAAASAGGGAPAIGYSYAPSWAGSSSAQGPTTLAWQKRDFVQRRYQAFHPQQQNQQQQQPTASTDLLSSNPWLGVSDMERLLVSCCQSKKNASAASESAAMGANDDDEDGARTSIRGALDDQLVLRFLTVVALHCHDLASRSLALAILERSLQQDQAEQADDEERRAIEAEILLGGDHDDADDSAKSVKEPSDEKEPPAKRQKELPEEEKSDGGNDTGEQASSRSRCGRRIHRFLAAGGLRILQQWLIDASTPVEKPVAASSGPVAAAMATSLAGRQQRPPPTVTQASPTGQLLLPLLEFLSSMPFDKNLIKKSKINKQIRSLSKDVDSLASDPNVGADTTHVESGGLPIRTVKGAVDRLKENWEEQAKSGTNQKELFANPLEAIQQTLVERLRVLESFSDGKDGSADSEKKEKPEWLKKVEEQQRIKGKKKASKAFKLSAGGSTADLARRERANERASLMKEDLQKAQEQRRLLVIKLRELKQKNLQEEQKARHSKNKRSIRWKDGEGSASTYKKRELLEEVFIIPDRNATENDNADEGEIITLLDDDPDEDMFAS